VLREKPQFHIYNGIGYIYKKLFAAGCMVLYINFDSRARVGLETRSIILDSQFSQLSDLPLFASEQYKR
jgi:hypothetical protein